MKYLAVVTFVLGLALNATADEVRLANGGKLEGIARQEGDRVIVEVKTGTISLPRSEVAGIVRGRTLLHEYRERHARVRDSEEASDVYDLALWAKVKGLSRHVAPLARRILKLDPDHREARGLLGFVRYGGRWMKEAERMRAQGYVLFQDEWVPLDVRNEILATEKAPKQAALKRLKEQKAMRLAEMETIPWRFGLGPSRHRDGGCHRNAAGGSYRDPYAPITIFPGRFAAGVGIVGF